MIDSSIRMGTRPVRIVLFEDNPADVRLIKEYLTESASLSFHLESFTRLQDGLEHISEAEIDIILLDLSLPDSMGLDTFTRAHTVKPGIPIVVLTGLADDDVAIRAVQEGAQDYLIKAELNGSLLSKAIRYAIERKRAQEILREARDELEARVRARTEELNRSNASLRAEMAERKRADEERRHLEQQLQHAQKMEALGTLAGGIAHDFNNTIATIMGQAELLLIDCPPEASARENLDIILQACRRGKDLATRILTFSRRKEGKREVVAIRQILKEAMKLVRASLPSTIKIFHDIHSSAGSAMILADPSQIHQVIMNLCANGAHAMCDKGGALSIGLTCLEGDLELMARYPEILRPGPYVHMSVTDTGHGIHPSIRDRIFDPFFTTKGPAEGTGMGLAVVYGIVNGHEGAIHVESEPGKGSTFHIFFPRSKGGAPLMRPLAKSVSMGKGCILLAEDESPMLETTKGLLIRLGYEVVAHGDSLKALDVFRRKPRRFDLIVTDQTMPNLTGTQLAREVRRIRPDIPVILCTGYSDTIAEEEVRSLSIFDVVSKPFSLGDLAAIVKEALTQAHSPSFIIPKGGPK